jgi:hypothetical protein
MKTTSDDYDKEAKMSRKVIVFEQKLEVIHCIEAVSIRFIPYISLLLPLWL